MADWTAEATSVIGTRGITRMLTEVRGEQAASPTMSAEQTDLIAREVVRVVSQERSTWTPWNLHAEAERALRGFRFHTPADREAANGSHATADRRHREGSYREWGGLTAGADIAGPS